MDASNSPHSHGTPSNAVSRCTFTVPAPPGVSNAIVAREQESNRIVMRLSTDMQRVGFAHLMTSDFARLSRETPGRLVSKLTNDIGFVQTAVQAALNTAIRDALSIVALVASMIYLDPVMSLIVLLVYPLAALPVASLSKRLRKVAKRTQDELGGMTSLLTEKLSGARLVKSFRLEDYASELVKLTDIKKAK